MNTRNYTTAMYIDIIREVQYVIYELEAESMLHARYGKQFIF